MFQFELPRLSSEGWALRSILFLSDKQRVKTLLLALLSIYIQPSWASQFVWNLSIGSEVKVVGDDEVPFFAGDWACVLTKTLGIDIKEIRQLECSLGDKEKMHLTAVCADFADYDMSVITLSTTRT